MVLTIRKKSSVLTNLYDFCVKGFSFETLDFFFIIAVIMIEWRRVKVLKTDNIKNGVCIWKNIQNMKLLDIKRGYL